MSLGAVQFPDTDDSRLELVALPVQEHVAGPGGAVSPTDPALTWRSPRPTHPVLTFPARLGMAAAPVARRPVGGRAGTGYLIAKRTVDILVALAALVVLSPLLIGVIVAIRATSPGPLLFRQERCGMGGRTFRLIKFRTMVSDAERIRHELAHLNEMSGPMFKVRLDPRVTRVGRVLRKFSMDELPQLVNVLWGDMTLVGPRPSIVAEVEQFTDTQRRRLEVKPGLTCLWQVSGRSDLSFDEWVALDLAYIDSRSFWLDVRILLRTIPAVISGRGAY